MARIDDLNAYIEQMNGEKAKIARILGQAAQSTGNRSALMEYQRIAQARNNAIDAHVKHAKDLIKQENDNAKAATKGTGSSAATTAANKAAAKEDQQEPEAKLAENKEKQLGALNKDSAAALGLGGPGIVDALKTGPGVANYTDGVPSVSSVPNAQTGAPQPIYSTPSTVTMLVPKKPGEMVDKDALAAEKQRLTDRKQLDKDVNGIFTSTTGKPISAETVFGSGGLKFGPDGKVVDNKTGLIFMGTPESYYEAQKRYNETLKPEGDEKSKFNEVTIPADKYQDLVGKVRDIVGDDTPEAPVSAVDKEIEARKILNSPAPDATIRAPDGLQLPKVGRVPLVPGVNDRGPLDLSRITAGQPLSALPPTDPAAAQANDLQRLADIQSQKVWDARTPQGTPVTPAEDYYRRVQNHAIATDPAIGSTVLPAQAEDILNQSTNPMIRGTSYLKAKGQPLTLDVIQKFDPATAKRLMEASAANTAGESGGMLNDIGAGALALTPTVADPAFAGKAALSLINPYAKEAMALGDRAAELDSQYPALPEG